MSPTDFKARFAAIWPKVIQERPINPKGLVGELMALLEDVLDVEQIQCNEGPNIVSFLFDLSPLGFSGMDYNIFVVSFPPANDAESQQQAVFLEEQTHAAGTLGFAFHLNLANDPPPQNRFVASGVNPVFLCGSDLERLLSNQIPKMGLAAIIRRQTPVHRLCPFSTSVEASGAMFRGRRSELALLVEGLDRSVAVTGARRLGKTSLLKRGYNILRTRLAEGRQRVFYFNCLSWSNFWHCCWMLAHKIDPKSELRLERADRNIWYMLERCSRNGAKPLLLFFDEVDALIDFDAANGWRFFNLLAAAKDAGFIRFVVAGYRSIARLVFGQSGGRSSALKATPSSTASAATPLLMALEYLELSPLTRKETDSLLSEPIHGVEMKFDNEPAVQERVWKNTAGYPFLVQFFGQRLFKMGFDKGTAQIGLDDVIAVEQGPELREFLETHFLENTLENGLPGINERACALLLAHEDGDHWTEQDFLNRCLQHQISLGPDLMGSIHHAVRNLFRAQIFNEENGRYSFTFPLMRTVLRGSYPDLVQAIQSLLRN